MASSSSSSAVEWTPAECSAKYHDLKVEVDQRGIALVTLSRPPVNSVTMRMHKELASIWVDLDADPKVKVIMVTGNGRAFSAGGDFEMMDYMMKNSENLYEVFRDTKDLVHNMVYRCTKPIISAINGVAVGAGMAVAICADISIASDKAVFNDGHTRLGVAAGDHACLLWPLLMGMAKTKYYLLTGRFIPAPEAERVGLISLCVPHDQLMAKAFEIASELANAPQFAVRFTKGALQQWLNTSSFDNSCALEMLTFVGADVREGMKSLKEKRPAQFPSARL